MTDEGVRPWVTADFSGTVRVLAASYAGVPAAECFAPDGTRQQWAHYAGQILRTPGCGRFDAALSRIVCAAGSAMPAAVALTTWVGPDAVHVAQIAVSPGSEAPGSCTRPDAVGAARQRTGRRCAHDAHGRRKQRCRGQPLREPRILRAQPDDLRQPRRTDEGGGVISFPLSASRCPLPAPSNHFLSGPASKRRCRIGSCLPLEVEATKPVACSLGLRSAGSGKQEAGSRKVEAGSRKLSSSINERRNAQ